MKLSKNKSLVFLGVLGWFASWAFFAKWLHNHQWRFFQGWIEAFTASTFATGLLVDLVVVSWMMIVLAVVERKRLGRVWCGLIVGSLTVSVSMSLLFYVLAKANTAPPKEAQHEEVNTG